MSNRWFNIGKKDEYGQQRRIEHRGRHLRASRTGGVSLRAQTRAAGVNVSANTQHGVRLSRTIGRNTQLALQNGRVVLRGRYGAGPHKLNLSKTGVTVSTRNALGTFNWVKPNRSSAKLLGVQVRGRKAAQLQAAFMLFQGIGMMLVLAVQLFVLLCIGATRLAVLLAQWLSELPFVMRWLMRHGRLWRARRLLAKPTEAFVTGNNGGKEQLLAQLTFVLLAWGRGDNRLNLPQTQGPAADIVVCGETVTAQTLHTAGQQLAELSSQLQVPQASMALALAHRLGQHARQQLTTAQLAELLLDLDDLALQQGPKTRLQEDLLAVIGDAAELRLTGNEL